MNPALGHAVRMFRVSSGSLQIDIIGKSVNFSLVHLTVFVKVSC
jgi:hypothetical protein